MAESDDDSPGNTIRNSSEPEDNYDLSLERPSYYDARGGHLLSQPTHRMTVCHTDSSPFPDHAYFSADRPDPPTAQEAIPLRTLPNDDYQPLPLPINNIGGSASSLASKCCVKIWVVIMVTFAILVVAASAGFGAYIAVKNDLPTQTSRLGKGPCKSTTTSCRQAVQAEG